MAYLDYTVIPYANPVLEEMQFKTLISNFDDLGQEQRKRKWLYPKRKISLLTKAVTLAQGRTLYQFYIDRWGSWQSFNFFKYELESYEGEYIGTGDGSTVIYNAPFRNATAYTIYLDGVEQTVVTDYVYTQGGGTDGADKIEFVTAPNEGERITCDFTGYLKVHCRFADDNLSFQTFYNKLRNGQIVLQGTLNE